MIHHASIGSPRLSMLHDDLRIPVVKRRRAVNTSDLRSCALVQSKMKTWKTHNELDM